MAMRMSNPQLCVATGGGTLLSLFGQFGVHDALRTAVLAAIGATVSFLVSLVLQRLLRRRNNP